MRLIQHASILTIALLALACGDASESAAPEPAPAPAPAPTAPAPAPTEPAPEPAAEAPAAPAGASASAGAAHYTAYCATCHGESGKGDGPGAAGLPVPPRDFTTGDFKFDADGNGIPGEDADLRMVISQGAAPFGGSPLMTPWGGILSDDQIDDIVAYMRSLVK